MARRRTGKSFRRKNKLWSLLIGILTLLALFAFAQGKVIKVSDGDTLTVLTPKGHFISVRLYGVDCPEARQNGGSEATEFTRSLAFMEEVRLTPMSKDQYGRTVAVVHLKDGRNLNEELLKSGHAWLYTSYCHESFCAAWKMLEQKAKQEKKGLWAKPNPQAPWNWRKNNR